MSQFDEAAARLEAAVFTFHGDPCVYQPRAGGPVECTVIVDRDVEVFDPLDVNATIRRDEAEFLNSEVIPRKGESFTTLGTIYTVGKRLKQSRETTRVIAEH